MDAWACRGRVKCVPGWSLDRFELLSQTSVLAVCALARFALASFTGQFHSGLCGAMVCIILHLCQVHSRRWCRPLSVLGSVISCIGAPWPLLRIVFVSQLLFPVYGRGGRGRGDTGIKATIERMRAEGRTLEEALVCLREHFKESSNPSQSIKKALERAGVSRESWPDLDPRLSAGVKQNSRGQATVPGTVPSSSADEPPAAVRGQGRQGRDLELVIISDDEEPPAATDDAGHERVLQALPTDPTDRFWALIDAMVAGEGDLLANLAAAADLASSPEGQHLYVLPPRAEGSGEG